MREWQRKVLRDQFGKLPARRVMQMHPAPDSHTGVSVRSEGTFTRIVRGLNAAIKAIFYIATTLAAIIFSYLQWDTSRTQAKNEAEHQTPRLQIIQSSEYPTKEETGHFPTLILMRNFEAARIKKIETTEYVGLRGKKTMCYTKIANFYQLNIETGAITPKPVLEKQLRKLARAFTHEDNDFDHSLF